MKEKNPQLLPSGLYDLLPPDAHGESQATQRLLSCFASFGYEQVSPPLLEFETSLLSGRGEAMGTQTFRVMDPLSHGMMGFRADMTLQVARIATTRLGSAPRPLRLCYAGPILRVKPEALMNQRQLTQAGIELIGTDSWAADAEVMIVAAESLLDLGITEISIDLNLPGLLGDLCPEAVQDADLRARIKSAIQRRDMAGLSALPLKNTAQLVSLMQASGPADKALAALKTLGLEQTASLAGVVAHIRLHCPQVTLTIDPLEYRGFDYHQGIGFSIFAKGLRHELGRGGRYLAAKDSATGFTLYVTHLLPLLVAQTEKKRILLAQDASPDAVRKLRKDGWITLAALGAKPREEAKRLNCTHIFEQGKIETL